MRLTVLSVAYPLARMGPDAVGGAEQILSQLDRALVQRGHRSLVIAAEGSQPAGTLIPVAAAIGALDEHTIAAARERHRAAICVALRRYRIDLVHMHGIDFQHYLPPPGVPALITLHGPASWYPPDALLPDRPMTWFNCVSTAQQRSFTPNPRFVAPIENGVPIEALRGRHAKRRFALMLGRIAPEKGVHLAIDAAKRADMPLLIAGEVFAYAEHQRYFHQEVRPRLDRERRLVGPVGFARKRRLLNAAQCLLVASTVPETSSLVAREACAAGTPVIGFASGALIDTIEHSRTGYLVQDVTEMAAAIARAPAIDPDLCRAVARERFSLSRMVERYLTLYQELVQHDARMLREARA